MPSTETRAAETVTVVWMMSVVTTVLCGLVALIILLAAGDHPDADRSRLFGRLLHFSALVTGSLSLVMLALVLKLRTQRPPPAITWFSVIVALLVIAAALSYR